MKAFIISLAVLFAGLSVHAKADTKDCQKRASIERSAKKNKDLVVADALAAKASSKNSKRRTNN